MTKFSRRERKHMDAHLTRLSEQDERDRVLGAKVREAFSFSGSAPFEFGKIVDAVRGTVSGPLWDAVCDVRDAIDAEEMKR